MGGTDADASPNVWQSVQWKFLISDRYVKCQIWSAPHCPTKLWMKQALTSKTLYSTLIWTNHKLTSMVKMSKSALKTICNSQNNLYSKWRTPVSKSRTHSNGTYITRSKVTKINIWFKVCPLEQKKMSRKLYLPVKIMKNYDDILALVTAII